MKGYKYLFSPGRIGPLEVKNRIKYAATVTNFNFRDGYVSDREVAYMEAQAEGGAGIVTTQGAYPDPKGEGKGFMGQIAIYHDRFIPGLARIAEAIHRHGALAALQIMHCGREGGVELDYCVMPSAVPQRLSYFKPPREMTLKEVEQAVKDHIAAARRAVAAGFDIIEISGIVGYLISAFISRYTNRRQDRYGGDLRSRCRLMVEVLQGIKAEVGEGVPVGIRLCGLELLDDRGGNTPEESLETFKIAEEAGADYVSVTIGWHESAHSVITRDVPMGHWLPVARRVKEVVSIPVMMAFRIFTPELAEEAIARGDIDFWEVCRPMIADPRLPQRAREGREGEIVPCLACNLCFFRLYYHQPIMCTVRPTLGHEGEPDWGYRGLPKAPRRKRVLVIGGGPAGMEFAATAAERGYEVVLCEAQGELGGSLRYAAKVERGDEELLRFVRYLEGRCKREGVQIRLSEGISPEGAKGFDTVVLATGAKYAQLPGEAPSILTPPEVFEGPVRGERAVVIGGQGVGIAVALYLSGKGLKVSIVEGERRLGRDVTPFYLWRYLQVLKGRGAEILTQHEALRFEDGRLMCRCPEGERTLEADLFVTAMREDREVELETWRRWAPEVLLVGDARRPRRLHNAVHEAYRLARGL